MSGNNRFYRRFAISMNSNHDVLSCKKCFYLRILAIIFWSAGLVVLSLLPNAGNLYSFSGQDKFLHLAAYLLNAWLACRSLQLARISQAKIIAIAMIYSVILGGLIELFQQVMTTSRQGEWLDFLANSIGAALGCAIFCLQVRLSSRHHDKGT